MPLNDLHYTKGSKTEHYRKGRGVASGNGKTCGKGTKGQGAHSHTKSGDFEGGQMPLVRRIPKFGFTSHKKVILAVVNLDDLNDFKDGEEVTQTTLIEKGLVKKNARGVKILGKGTLEKKLTVKANAFSKSASKAIADKGGAAEVIK